MLRFDHIVIAVGDLEAAAHRLKASHWLRFHPGGIHPIGTKNWSNLFPDGSYIELLAVHDPSQPYGALVNRFVERRGDSLFNWALRTDDIDAVALRTGVEPTKGSIESAEGQTQGSWQIVAHPDPRGTGVGLPFFIQYDGAEGELTTEERRARTRAFGIELTEGTIDWVQVGADPDAMSSWLGEHDLDIRVSNGRGLLEVGLTIDASALTLS